MRPHKKRVKVFINQTKYELQDATQTGRSLKELAGIPLTDVLFLQRPGEDLVIPNDDEIKLKCGDHLHSQPPADYGAAGGVSDIGHEGAVEVLPQPNGWSFVVVSDFPLPAGFSPNLVKLLIKLPPEFPDASPDMFWVSPATTVRGKPPRSTSTEQIVGEMWQRFSWHLKKGSWRPGASSLRDFMRCVRARLLRGD